MFMEGLGQTIVLSSPTGTVKATEMSRTRRLNQIMNDLWNKYPPYEQWQVDRLVQMAQEQESNEYYSNLARMQEHQIKAYQRSATLVQQQPTKYSPSGVPLIKVG